MSVKCPKCQTDNPDTQRFCGECATSLQPSKEIDVTATIEAPKEELTRGTTFAGRYEIIEELGKGGMGRVYRVEDTKLKQEVALKLIKPEIAKDKKTIERFRNELKLAREIAHRNVCRMYDLNEERGIHYITMEYVRGEDLRSLIRRIGQLPIGKSISITKQICEGLSEAHRLGVVHRDLKSNNIMIDKDGNVRIMDFGIARSLEAKGITGAGVIIGTPEYMSPEQVEGKEVDQRSDFYSLGIILYEMVTGKVPFEGDTPFTIGMKHKGEIPQNPKELNTQISDDLNRLILRCLEKEKDKRYQSAGEVRTELANIEKGIPTTERIVPDRKPLTSREITVQFSLKKIFIPAFVVIAITILGLIVWSPWANNKVASIPSDKPSIAILNFENNSRDASYDNWRDALPIMLITDLQQSQLVQVIGVERIYGALKKLDLDEAEKYSADDIKKVASEVGVSHVLSGSYINVGNKFIINASLIEASNPAVVTPFNIEGFGEESITDSVDDLTRQIKMALDLSQEKISEDIDEKIGLISTSSLEAYKFYSDGEMFFNDGDWQQCIEAMEKAIALDPEFAMAYRKAAVAFGNLGNQEKMIEYFQKAFDLSKGDRLSERLRLIIQGMYYQYGAGPSISRTKESRDETFRIFHRLVELYPSAGIGHNQLGVIYTARGDWEEAVKHYKINVDNESTWSGSYGNYASLLRLQGKYDESIEACEKYINNFSDHHALRRIIARTLMAQGKYDSAIDEVNNAFVLNPLNQNNFARKGEILQLKGDFLEAEKEYNKDNRGRKRTENIYITQGRLSEGIEIIEQNIVFAKETNDKRLELTMRRKLIYLFVDIYQDEDRAIQEFEQALNLAYDNYYWNLATELLSQKGLAYLVKNSLSEAEKTAEKLNNLIVESTGKPGFNKRSKSEYFHLMGRIELKKKNFKEATDYFNQALALEPHGRQQSAEYIRSLAMAYYESGEFEKAAEEYLRIAQLTTGRLEYGDIYAKAFYMLGKINEQMGNKTKAIEHYEKFLDLWKDADPGIAEVEDARKRLAGLKDMS